ncbi:hypothetical protein ACMTAU_20500, partial [Alcaligenes pakistanensis]
GMWRKTCVFVQNSSVIHYLCYYGELFGRNARAEYNVLAGLNGAAQLEKAGGLYGPSMLL